MAIFWEVMKGLDCRSVWSIYPILFAIRNRCNQFNFWQWIPHRLNGVDDSIAANARRWMREEVWIHRPPSSLVFDLQADGLPCPPRS